jgi:hypothetical protein
MIRSGGTCLKAALIILASVLLQSGAAVAATTVHGTATLVDGSAFAKGTVMLVDSQGIGSQSTTSSAGKFDIKVNPANAPYLLMTSPSDGSAPLFGIAFSTGKANVDIFTDLITGMLFYAIAQQTPASEFTNGLPDVPLLAQWSPISTMLQAAIQTWLTANNVKPKKFSFISTPFSAGTKKKLGHVIEETSITSPLASGLETIEISDGASTQDLTFTASLQYHTVNVSSTLNGVSNAEQGTVIPANPMQATIIASLNSLLQELQGIVNQKKSKLQVSDVDSLFDQSDYLNNGEDDVDPTLLPAPNANWAKIAESHLVTQLRGLKMSNIQLTKIYPIVPLGDNVNDILTVIYSFNTGKNVFASGSDSFKCPEAAGQCFFYGNHQIADTTPGVQFVEETTSDQNNPNNSFPILDIKIVAPSATVNSTSNQPTVTALSGGTYFNGSDSASLPLFAQAVVTQLSPGGGAPSFPFSEDQFELTTGSLEGIAPAPHPGDVFTLSTMPVSGNCPDGTTPPCVYKSTLTGLTSETVQLVSPSLNGTPDPSNGGTLDHLITAAPLGKAFRINWKLPGASALSSVALTGFVTDCASNTVTLETTKPVTVISTTGTIRYPATLPNSGTINEASFTLDITNLNGSASKLIYRWGGC